MTTQPEPGWMMPNRGARAILNELEQLIGKNGLMAVYKIAGLTEWRDSPPPDDLGKNVPFTQLTAIYRAIDEIYGERSARGLVRQANRNVFGTTWGEYGILAAFKDPAFQALPLQERVRTGCKALGQAFSEISDLDLQLVEEADSTVVQLSHCPDCLGLRIEKPGCAGMLGWLEGAFSAICPGDSLIVQEVECRGVGHDFCVFAISLDHDA